MSSPINDAREQRGADDAAGSKATSGAASRHGAGLFDIRNIIGLLMVIYGLVLLVTSFMTSTADKAKADGVNLNLWTGLGLLALGAVLITWAVTRPIVVDERELAADKAKAEREGHPSAH